MAVGITTYMSASTQGNLLYDYLMLLGLVEAVQGFLLSSALVTICVGFLISGDIFNEMCTRWLSRFHSLRNVCEVKDIGEGVDPGIDSNAVVCHKLRALYRLAPLLRKDAFERYAVQCRRYVT